MSSKKKSTKSSNKSTILRCTNITFEKKPKKDRKGATLMIRYETASGEWSQKKVFEDIFNFIESTCKSTNNKKTLGHYTSDIKKYKNEYLNDNKTKNALKLIKDIFNTIGKHQKILSKDSKITAFIGAKRSHLTDIKSAQILSNKSSKPKTKRVPSIGAATMMSSLGGSGSGNRKYESTSDNNIMKEEMETMKRKHMFDFKNVCDENESLKRSNDRLQEMNNSIIEAKEELEERVLKYEKELGKDIIDENIAQLFAHEFKKPQDPAQKYYEQVKKQKGMIDMLEQQVIDLSHNNDELKTKLERAKYVADHLATEVSELANPNIEQLEEDYREVEAELDEVTKLKETYEHEMKTTAAELDVLGVEVAKMKPYYEEYPNLLKSMEKQRKENEELIEKINKFAKEKDEFEHEYLKLKKKDEDNISQNDHKKVVKNYKNEIKELNEKFSIMEREKNEKISEMEKIKQEMAEIKMKLGQLEAENNILERGGGRDINLQIQLDMAMDNEFSIFKKDEFEYDESLSRQQLILWCQHFKLLIKQINNELCQEINHLSQTNQTLENYIQLKGLPLPEDIIHNNNNNQNNNMLPHPLPSMNYIADLEIYNPTKKQLKHYIDLMFNEWRTDEIAATQMIAQTGKTHLLLKELNNETNNETNNEANESLKKQLETLYLKQEETSLEFNKQIKELKEMNEELSKQLKTEQQKNIKIKDPSEMTGTLIKEKEEEEMKEEEIIIDENMEDQLLLNRLNDTEQYVKDLEDNMKQLEFETTQQKQILEREYKYDLELLNIDLEESRAQCDDYHKQIEDHDENLLSTEFRNELQDSRNDNVILKKKHLSEIRNLECNGDELLREINLLRIKTDRMDENTDEQIIKMEIELNKKNKELQHFEAVASNLSNVKEKLDVMEADRNELEKSYLLLAQNSENEKQILKNEMNKLDLIKKEYIKKYEQAMIDIENIKKSQGIDSEKIITTTELVIMKEQMNSLKNKKDYAIKSKIKLLETSSLEIERMRDEIKILNGYMNTNYRTNYRYSIQTNSTIGSSIPYNNGHQTMFDNNNNNNNNNDNGYVNSAWNYTMGMLTSIGSVFNNNNNNKENISNNNISNNNNDEYNSSLYNIQNNRNQRQSQSHYIQPSMIGSYSGHEISHKRGLSAAVYNVKRERNRNRNGNNHQRKISRHKSYNSKQFNNNHNRIYSNMSIQQSNNMNMNKGHRNKQPSKQDIMIENEENENVKDAMSKIFKSFEDAQDNVKKQSIDISGVGSDGLNMFSLDDMINNNNNNNNRQTYIINDDDENDNNNQYFDNILNSGGMGGIGGGDDFWNTNINQDENDDNIHQYSDDDRYGIGAMDLNTL